MILLRWFPFLAKFYQLNRLSGFWWAQYLTWYPYLEKYCDWHKLETTDWIYLVHYQPQFKEHPMYKLKML